ncbi:hypothetical protein ACTFIY_010688 [Dictyostelium cf. discoideum]
MEWVNELKYILNEVINIITDKEKSIITIYKLFKEIKKKKLLQASDFKIYDPNIWLISYDSTVELKEFINNKLFCYKEINKSILDVNNNEYWDSDDEIEFGLGNSGTDMNTPASEVSDETWYKDSQFNPIDVVFSQKQLDDNEFMKTNILPDEYDKQGPKESLSRDVLLGAKGSLRDRVVQHVFDLYLIDFLNKLVCSTNSYKNHKKESSQQNDNGTPCTKRILKIEEIPNECDNNLKVQKINNNNNNNYNYNKKLPNYYQKIGLKLNLISNNIINNNRLEYWFSKFLNFNNNNNKTKYNSISYTLKKDKDIMEGEIQFKFKMKINKEYSSIKISNEISKEYFNKQVLCLYDLNCKNLTKLGELEKQGKLNYRKILIKYNLILYEDNEYFIPVFFQGTSDQNGYDLYKKDGILDLTSSSGNCIIEVCSSNFFDLDYVNSPSNIQQYHLTTTNTEIPKLYLPNFYYGAEEYRKEDDDDEGSYDLNLNILMDTISTKNIKYRSILNRRKPNFNNTHTNSFTLFNDCNDNNKEIESIKVYRDFFEPLSIVSIENFEKLHTLVIPIQFHHLIGLSLDKDDACCIGVKKFTSIFLDDVKDYYKLMIKSLNKSKSLRNLTIKNWCENSICIKSLLSSSTTTTSNLEYFKIKNFGILISNDTFSELNNNTIKTLVLDDDSHTYCLKSIFQSILININLIQLYSITIKTIEKRLDSILDEIINLSNKLNEIKQLSKNLIEFKIYVRI